MRSADAFTVGQRGLTLIETLVAFSIIAGVVSGVLALLAQTSRSLSASEDRMLANILVNNLLVEDLAATRRNELGSTQDEVTFAGRQFITSRTGLDVQDGVVQITIGARLKDVDQTLAQASVLKIGR
ncbi:MAG: type II secretion system minor pseudopilin GspI [Pseudomonadota bacterium]